jgi:hypothetical protein
MLHKCTSTVTLLMLSLMMLTASLDILNLIKNTVSSFACCNWHFVFIRFKVECDYGLFKKKNLLLLS